MAKHLFIDDRFVAETSGLTRRFHQARKCERNPVIRADRPWEKDAAFVDSAMVVHDEAAGRFRAWYQGGACYGPDDGSNMCYATSVDGIEWHKPPLGVVDFEGSADNNIVLAATCMMHDPAPIIDPADPDPRRRYKAVWWGGRRDAAQEGGWLLGHCVGFSADGIRWQEHPGNPVWVGDAEVAVPFGLERTGGRLVMYSSADGYGMRVTARSESDDFVDWDLPPAPVFVPDDDDPPGTEAAGLAATDYEGTHIGMLWVARNLPEPGREEWRRIVERNRRQGFFGPPIEMNNVRCREMHTELVASRDGVRWDRIHREPLIPLGPEASWDETLLLAARPLVHGDEVYLYYTGYGRAAPTPGASRPELIQPWNIETGLATLRLDGFASLSAEGTGVLVTEPFAAAGTAIAVNADVDGSLRVEVLDEEGRPVPGLAREQAQPIVGDHLRARAVWSSGSRLDSSLRGRTIRLKMYLEHGDLYSLSIVEEIRTMSRTIDIGTRLEPIVDRYLIDRLDGTRLALQQPRDEGPVLRSDRPWEGMIGYFTVLKDGDTYRAYYRGKSGDGPDGGEDESTCYAESTDGCHWTKPDLGLVEIDGSRDNNVILGPESPAVRHNFGPFLDTGPAAGSFRLKALAGLFKHDQLDATTGGMLLYGSEDGTRWQQLRDEPVIDQSHRGPTISDTTSVPTFWSVVEGCYVAYLRDWLGPPKRPGHAGSIRWIARTTSPDLLAWTRLEKVRAEPVEHLYTSNVQPYFRAPHLSIAFPARFQFGRQVVTAEECRRLGLTPDYVEDCSDAVFMTSRGGLDFDRTFPESFIRPGIGPNNWITRTNYPATGLVPTGPYEMSLYLMQDNAQATAHLRRYSLRLDGFASVHAPYAGGEMVTRPLAFAGTRLLLNFSTSSAGSIRVELQDAQGRPLPGYTLGESRELIGNHIDREVSWASGADVAALAGRAVRLRLLMKDADLFALRFR